MSSGVRADLLAAAVDCIETCGYAGTSIAGVAERAGMLKGNVAYYYRTKAELLRDVVAARRERIFAELQPAAADDAAPRQAILRFVNMVESWADQLAQHGCPVGGLAGELGRSGDVTLHATAATTLVEITDWLAAQFAQIAEPAQARDAAEHLMSLAQGAASMAHALADPAVVRRRMAAAREWLAMAFPA